MIRDRLYCWGGDHAHLPKVHYSDDKQKFTSLIDEYCLPELNWEIKSTTGTPPVGVRKYACANIGNSIFYYGGNCKPRDCFHDNLFELNTLTHNWREMISSDINRPMRKIACGMMSFKSNGQDNLLLLGGLGVTPAITQIGSQYIPSPTLRGYSYTNETHVTSVFSSLGIQNYLIYDFHPISICISSGEWKSPRITGDRPPTACAYFSINSLPENKGIMFGGLTINETGVFNRVNDLFLLSFPQDVVVSC